MKYSVLACDYDGTLASHGVVAPGTVGVLVQLKARGIGLVLVTGRQLKELQAIFPQLDEFHRVVAENGAVLYRPETKELRLLATPPPQKFIEVLKQLGVAPLATGHVIIATWEPQHSKVLEAIRLLGAEMQVIFNKGAVMVLPSGVNKASGLACALRELQVDPAQVVAVGDAENDHALLDSCGCGAAVANAIPALKEHADWIAQASNGAGVAELIDDFIRRGFW
jgi:HAD superfamily hydrolase (TIGR01484 family)